MEADKDSDGIIEKEEAIEYVEKVNQLICENCGITSLLPYDIEAMKANPESISFKSSFAEIIEFYDQLIIANVKSSIKGIVAKPAFHTVATNEFNPAEYNKYINLHLKDYEQFLSSEYSEFVQE